MDLGILAGSVLQGGGRKASNVLVVGADPAERLRAAEVAAAPFSRGVHRVDLSQVVSRYIGSTEANLRRIFAAAERSGGVLFLDEADALFGKRSGVRDAHDRYADPVIARLGRTLGSRHGLVIWGMRSHAHGAIRNGPCFDAVVRLQAGSRLRDP